MINKINVQTNMPVTMKQAPKQVDETNVTAQNFVSVPNNNWGMNALGNYGKSMINFANKLDIQPLLPTVFNDINSIDGERIYDSKGNLHSIVKETPTSKTTCYVPLDNQNTIDFIETIDKKTGKTVFTQQNHINSDGKYDEMYVTKFNARTGKEESFTCYENGKIAYYDEIHTVLDGNTPAKTVRFFPADITVTIPAFGTVITLPVAFSYLSFTLSGFSNVL